MGTVSGFVDLSELYKWAQQNDGLHDAFKADGEKANDYKGKCKQVVGQVPRQKGFYAWGYFDDLNQWRTAYVGQTGAFGKTGTGDLHNRLLDVLQTDARPVFWRISHSEQAILYEGERTYPENWAKRRIDWLRHLRRYPSDAILWVVAGKLERKDIHDIENHLIEILRPSANNQRPLPSNRNVDSTVEIFREFRIAINELRNCRHLVSKGG